MNVIVSPILPIAPGHGEVARRIVRHGLADVLTWLGEPIGPKPEEQTHAFTSSGVDGLLEPTMFVSQWMHDEMLRWGAA